ncbi:MAG: hypothetical protein AB1916_08565 [Thermodesulfobacteriota bacterium]
MIQHSPQLTPLAFVRKRFIPLAVTFCAVMLAALAVVVSLPSIYRSWGTILVEGRVAQMDILRTSVAGVLQEHLTSVQQTVLNRANLVAIIRDFDLYPELRDKLSEDELVERVREDILFETTRPSMENIPPFGRMATDTSMVRIGYQSRIPQVATSVAIVLVNRFMEESARRREGKAQDTYLFLRNQVDQTKVEVEDVERDIARFKKDNIRSLPELMNMNLMTMERIQREMDAAQMELNLARERSLYLEGQLAIQEPLRYTITSEGQKVLSQEEQVRQMRSQLLAMRAVQSDKHPDVIRLSRRLAALEGVLTTRERLRGVLARLGERQGMLAEMQKKYTPQHPDVVALEKEVAILARESEYLSAQSATPQDMAEKQPDNPAYISLTTQLAQARLEIVAKQDMLDTLAAKYEETRRRIEETPGVEQEFIDLQRRYDTLKASLRDLSTRMQSAKEAMDLEQQDLGEKITVLETPVIPERPFKPDRTLLFLLSLVLASGAGLLAGFAVESFDPTVHGPHEATLMTGLPLLGVIPSLETASERAARLKRRRVSLVAGLGVLVVTLAVWTLFTPLRAACSKLSELFRGLF